MRLLAPVLPSKIVCVGKNYAAHAAEFGMEVPEEPLLFLKPSTAVIGPGDPIQLLPISQRVDYEGELAVVIGRLARRVRAEDAVKYILGYTCANDVTLRDLQKMDDQWARAKGFDGSCPLGPWIETELDPNDIRVETRLNGEIRQAAQTSDMVFGVAELIEYITEFMTLLPGDVLLTGTPEGVGRLAPGDVVEVEVEGIGTLSNPVADVDAGRGPLPVRARAVRARSTWGTRGPRCSAGCSRGTTAGSFVLRVEDTDASRVTEEAYPRRAGVAPLARPGLGRGSRRRRPARSVPAVAAHRHLPRARRPADRARATRTAATARPRSSRSDQAGGDRAGRAARRYDGRCRG